MTDMLIRMLWPLHFKGKLRLVNRLVPLTGTRTGRVFGVSMPLNLADLVQRFVYLGCFEPEETRLLKNELRPGMTFVDIGANVGYFSFMAAKAVGASGRVIAVEPSPYVESILRTAVETNGVKNVTVMRTAVGAEAGELTLYIPPASHHNHAPSPIANPGWTPQTVPVRRLDELIASLGIDSIDVLKVDVEGHENAVLAGAESMMRAGRIGAMLVELNEWAQKQVGSSSKALWDWIVDCGYEADRSQPVFAEGAPINVLFRARPR